MMLHRLVLAGVLLAAGSPAHAEGGKVVGWRGDGTGRFPGANPPTVWYLKENGESKNILWKVKLPCYSWATPIIVGDKIFTRSEPFDLVCLNKNTGEVLWIRSHPAFVAIPDAEKKANPAFKEIEGLVAQLQAVNNQFASAGWSEDLCKKKYDLQKLIDEKTSKIDGKYALPPDKYVESWAGYTGQTPCSDGQFIYFTSACGVTACYDLDGNKKWARHEQMLQWAEHGQGWSPTLIGDTFLVPIIPAKDSGPDKLDIQALNGNTGEQIWRRTYNPAHIMYSIVPFKVDGVDIAFGFGNFFRVSNGQVLSYADMCLYAVGDGNRIYSIHNTGHIAWYKVESPTKVVNMTPNGRITVPPEDENQKWNPMSNFWSSAPLYDNGLLYATSQWGRLAVVDTVKGQILYVKKLPFDFKNPQSRKTFGMGMGASPALGGKYIYMIDSAGCTIVMEPGREYRQIAKNNIDYTVPRGWEVRHWIGPHHEQTEASLVFDGNRIYIRGEQFLYCVGEK